MIHILSFKEYAELLLVNCLNARGYDMDHEYIEQLFEDCKYWQIEMHGMNHFLSMILERLERDGYDTKKILDWVYQLPDSHSFQIGEGGLEFTDRLMDMEASNLLTLEEQVIETHRSLLNE